MSQCFNLAHAELLHLGLADKLSEGGQDTYLTDRTMALFELKNNITRKLKDKYEVPEQQEGGELNMVDSMEATQSEFVTVDLVESSPTKKCVVVDPGSYEESQFGKRLTVKVNIDGMVKRWRPNKETVINMQSLGVDTTAWLSKLVNMTIEVRQGKKSVIGRPDPGEIATPPQTQPIVETVVEQQPAPTLCAS